VLTSYRLARRGKWGCISCWLALATAAPPSLRSQLAHCRCHWDAESQHVAIFVAGAYDTAAAWAMETHGPVRMAYVALCDTFCVGVGTEAPQLSTGGLMPPPSRPRTGFQDHHHHRPPPLDALLTDPIICLDKALLHNASSDSSRLALHDQASYVCIALVGPCMPLAACMFHGV
jgi:hypothetical protein